MVRFLESLSKLKPQYRFGIFELSSFALYSLMCIGGIVLLSYVFWLFILLMVVDAIGTVFSNRIITSADRAFFFFAFVILSSFAGQFNIFLLVTEILILITGLDFSFLLASLGGTSADLSVLTSRVKSYAFTVIPAALLTYAMLVYGYTANFQFSAFQALVAFGLASVGAVIAVYAIASYVLSFDDRKSDYLE